MPMLVWGSVALGNSGHESKKRNIPQKIKTVGTKSNVPQVRRGSPRESRLPGGGEI